MKLSTEEDVKIKIVLDYLKSLGFKEDELSFEDSFLLYLGRSTYKVDTLEQRTKAQPRLDILVKRNNVNLFVVEVKSDLITITEEEIKQATSYAKLVHPVAPFTIITNGKEFRLYYSLTREEIKNNELEIIDNYKIALPDDYMYEALKHFIGYSKENFLIYFQNQVLEGMKTLLGSGHESTKKYIPELHTPRGNFISDLRQFINSEKSVFALLGESGTGKTCSLCNIALKLVGDGLPVFFYKSFDLIKGIIETISEDINWEFSSQYSEIEIFKRFEDLFGTEKILIFIDAIDEWERPNKVAALNRFVSIISKRNIKLIISCKTNAWNEFLTHKSVPTVISQEIYQKEKDNDENGYPLEPFSEKEFFRTIDKYRKFFGYNGPFESNVLDECKRSPFLLRVVFEVARKHQLEHLTFSSKEIFHKYYKDTLEKVGNEEVAEATLKKVAESLYSQNSDSIDIDSLRESLGLSVNEPLLTELFTYNVLDKIDDEVNCRIRFYFDKFRDYIITFHVKKWHVTDNVKFQKDYEQIKPAGVQQEALSFFYQFADVDKKNIVDSKVRRNAEKYLDFYLQVINDHFPNLKNRFSPYTDGDIGFISEISISRSQLGIYGFRELNSKDKERLKFIAVDKVFSREQSNTMYLYGADMLHATASAMGFTQINIEKEVIKHEIEDQINKIIEEGGLNEKNNKYLSTEKALAIYYVLLSGDQYISGIDMRERLKTINTLPINLNDIKNALRYKKALRYYEDKLVREKREQGVIKETWDGSHVSYSYSYSDVDWAWIKKKADSAVKNKIELKDNVRYTDLEIIEKNLSEAIDCLRTHGILEIKEKLLPENDAVGMSRYTLDDYSPDTMIKYIFRTYKLFLQEYKTIIETNFPTLKDHFKLYSLMPIKVFIHIREHSKGSKHVFSQYVCKNNELGENEVILCNEDDLEMDRNKGELLFKGKYHKVDYYAISFAHSFLSWHKNYAEFDIPSELGSLRNLVYSKIVSEIKDVIKALFNYYGVQKK